MSGASIKKGVSLPAPPLPPTKPYRGDDYVVCIDGTLMRKTSVAAVKMAIIPPSAYLKAAAKGHEKRHAEALKMWERIANLAAAGYSYEQIAEDVGYTPKAVQSRIKILRAEGWNIPLRKAGRKAGEAWAGKKQ